MGREARTAVSSSSSSFQQPLPPPGGGGEVGPLAHKLEPDRGRGQQVHPQGGGGRRPAPPPPPAPARRAWAVLSVACVGPVLLRRRHHEGVAEEDGPGERMRPMQRRRRRGSRWHWHWHWHAWVRRGWCRWELRSYLLVVCAYNICVVRRRISRVVEASRRRGVGAPSPRPRPSKLPAEKLKNDQSYTSSTNNWPKKLLTH